MGEVIRSRSHSNVGQWPPKSDYRKRWALLAAVAVAILLLIFDGEPVQQGQEATEVPAEVVGRWTSGDARYRDRALVVTRSDITLELGQGVPPERGDISGIRLWTEGENAAVQLIYVTDGGVQEMVLLLEGPDRMRLRNPRDVLWTRERP